jgi:hypothetical protein
MRADSAAALAYHEVLAQMVRRLVAPFFKRCPAITPPVWSTQCTIVLDAMLQASPTSILLQSISHSAFSWAQVRQLTILYYAQCPSIATY